eukprot:scaffold32302_cov15-Tisochrysis_lutea.AAC.4
MAWALPQLEARMLWGVKHGNTSGREQTAPLHACARVGMHECMLPYMPTTAYPLLAPEHLDGPLKSTYFDDGKQLIVDLLAGQLQRADGLLHVPRPAVIRFDGGKGDRACQDLHTFGAFHKQQIVGACLGSLQQLRSAPAAALGRGREGAAL